MGSDNASQSSFRYIVDPQHGVNNTMAPLVANYYLTYRCNARCHFCDIWALEPGQEATFETIEQNLKDLKRLGVRYIDFTGGEPLLRSDVVEIYRLSKQMGFYTSMTTNTILYPKKAKEMQGLVDFLNFSLDGADADTHDHSRGVKIFDTLVESVGIALELGEFPVLNHTVTAQNYQRIHEVAALGKELGVRVWFNPAFTAHSHYNDKKNPTPEIANYIEEVSRRYANVGYNRAALELIRAGGNDTANPRCKAVDSVIAISPNDELLLPCYHFSQKPVPIEGRLYELYRESEVVQEYRESQGRLSVCEGCTVWCYLIPSFFKGIDKYWLLNQMSYAGEFLARKRFLQRV
jgi:MoaA/NifB/PqqE/SkfB family radical SAM enzyme